MAFEPRPAPILLPTLPLCYRSTVLDKCGQENRTPFLPSSQYRGQSFIPRASLVSPSSVLKSSVLGGSDQEDWAALSHLAPTQRVERALPQAQQAKNTGLSITPPCSLSHSMLGETSWKDLGLPSPPQCPLIEQRASLQEKQALSPLPASVQWPKVSTQGWRQTIKMESSTSDYLEQHGGVYT